MKKILGFNVDHIATLRNARGEGYPNLIDLAKKSINFGANQITAHLREDRRHINDEDIINLKKYVNAPLNMEMALNDEMIEIATKKVLPFSVCLVPEKRNEVTTEGGLNLIPIYNELKQAIELFHSFNIKVSLFIDAVGEQIKYAIDLSPDSIEINTGTYCNLSSELQIDEAIKIKNYSKKIHSKNISVHAGHGLNLNNIKLIADINEIVEFNIGHFIVSRAIDVGLEKSIKDMCIAINR